MPNMIKMLIMSTKVVQQDQASRFYNFFILNSAEHKFILLINVKMPTIVGILTFISMINTTSERLNARNH